MIEQIIKFIEKEIKDAIKARKSYADDIPKEYFTGQIDECKIILKKIQELSR